MLTSIFQAKEVYIKTRSPSASLSPKGQGTKFTTVKRSIKKRAEKDQKSDKVPFPLPILLCAPSFFLSPASP